MGYRDAEGNTVAEYVYDAFGRIVAQNGTMANMFTMRYSTKYYEAEAGLYYYGKRYYSPAWRRWLTRDPIGEEGGANLYGFCKNGSVYSVDPIGKNRYRTVFSLDPRKDQWHVGVAVDTWQCRKGRWQKTGVASFDFGIDDSSLWNRLGTFFVTVGEIVETPGNALTEFTTISSSPRQDIEMLKRIRAEIPNPPLYSFFFNNCIQWSNRALRYGMEK